MTLSPITPQRLRELADEMDRTGKLVWSASHAEMFRQSAAALRAAADEVFRRTKTAPLPQKSQLHWEVMMSKGKNWQWWASQNDEHWTSGPYGSRSEAISGGLIEFNGEPFMVMRATPGRARFDIFDGGDVAEALDNANEDLGPDGESAFEAVTSESFNDLAQRLNAVVADWGQTQSVYAYRFDQTADQESIDPTVHHAWVGLGDDARMAILNLIDNIKEGGEPWMSPARHFEDIIKATNPVAAAFIAGMRGWHDRIHNAAYLRQIKGRLSARTALGGEEQ